MSNAETACTGHDFAKPGDLQHRNPKKVFFYCGWNTIQACKYALCFVGPSTSHVHFQAAQVSTDHELGIIIKQVDESTQEIHLGMYKCILYILLLLCNYTYLLNIFI